MILEAKVTLRSQAKHGVREASPTASPPTRPPRRRPEVGQSRPGAPDSVAVSGTTSQTPKSRLDLGSNRLGGGALRAAVPVIEAASKLVAPVVDRILPPAPSGGPKSAVLEAQTSRFRAVARQHETSNSFNREDAGERWKDLHAFLSEPRGPGALSDGTPGGKPTSKDQNSFAERVRAQVAALGEWVLTRPADAKLTPTDLYHKALEINRGDAFNARLTAHNMLKDAAATEAGHPQTDAVRNNAIIQRLVNLRDPRTKDDGNYTDKMGPWYHTFAVGVISAATKGLTGSNGAADFVGTMTNDKVKQRSDGPGRVGDAQEEAARLWANRVFDFSSAAGSTR